MNDYEKLVHNYFPKAKTIANVTSNAVSRIMDEQGIKKEKILLATSICSDEVNHNKHSFAHQFNSEEFILGGITGYPFSGETGLAAYLSHIPEGGAALIVFGPHIGISKDNNIGYNKRKLQLIETPTCGALTGILQRLNTDQVAAEYNKINSSDYQVDFIANKLFAQKGEIFNSNVPIIEITRQSYSVFEKDIRQLLTSKKDLIVNQPVYLLGGILINTDMGFDDYYEERIFEKI